MNAKEVQPDPARLCASEQETRPTSHSDFPAQLHADERLRLALHKLDKRVEVDGQLRAMGADLRIVVIVRLLQLVARHAEKLPREVCLGRPQVLHPTIAVVE